MLLLDQPFVSNFLRQTIVNHNLPVIDTIKAKSLDLPAGTKLLSEQTAVRDFQNGYSQLLYSNSENSLDWVSENLSSTDLPRQIALLKDKVRFRQMLAPLYPDFKFSSVAAHDLPNLDVSKLPLPFIIKPAVGFFSIGVHKVNSLEEWPDTLAAIEAELASVTAVFPEQVLDTTNFIVEACIPGDEYAIDAYFDDQGHPVIVNIMQHPFSSVNDVSDRAYITSKAIISRQQPLFQDLLAELGKLAGLRSFPVHAEVRVDADGKIVPIEVNPLRFGGWCAVDIAYYAFGFNPYLMFLRQQKPDWESIFSNKGDEVTGLIVLDRYNQLFTADIAGFDAQRLLAQFSKPLDWRPIEFEKYPVFGFLIMETSGADMAEIDAILQSDLTEFLQIRTA